MASAFKPLFGLVIAGFAFVQALALFVGAIFTELIASGQLEPAFGNPNDPFAGLFLFAYIVVAAIVMLVVLRYYKGKRVFLLAELLLIFASFQLLFSIFMTEAPATILAILLLLVRLKKPGLQSILLLFVSGTVGALLGSSLGLIPSTILAVLLACYDVIAVFFTKHMVTLAKGLAERGAAFSVKFELPAKRAPGEAPKKPLSAEKRFEMRAKTSFADRESLELGAGDLVIPALISTAALKAGGPQVLVWGLPISGAAIATAIGAVIGAVLLLAIIRTRKGFFPALPPLVFSSLLALGVYLVV